MNETLMPSVPSVNAVRYLGELVFSDFPLDDDCLHLIDGGYVNENSFVSFIDTAYKADKSNFIDEYIIINGKLNNVTFNDGDISNFTSSNYFTCPSFDCSKLTEAQVCFTTGSDVSSIGQGIIFSSSDELGLDDTSTFCIYNNAIYLANKPSGSNPSYITTGLSVSPNTKYWLKITQSGTVLTPYLSTDGINFTKGNNVTRTRNLKNGFGLKIYSTPTTYNFKGIIHLKETYIKLNNALFWVGYIKAFGEDAWNEYYNAKGKCELYYYDNINKRVKLPKYEIPYFKYVYIVIK